MIKLSDAIDIYSQKLTATGKRRKKGGRVWANEVVDYLIKSHNWTDVDGCAQSPSTDVSLWPDAGRISFIVADDYEGWDIEINMDQSDKVVIDEQNSLIIIKDILAIKV